MNKLIQNWCVHNLVAHPLGEIIYRLLLPFAGHKRAERVFYVIHDATLPTKPPRPKELWVNEYSDIDYAYRDKEGAEHGAASNAVKVAVRYVEAVED